MRLRDMAIGFCMAGVLAIAGMLVWWFAAGQKASTPVPIIIRQEAPRVSPFAAPDTTAEWQRQQLAEMRRQEAAMHAQAEATRKLAEIEAERAQWERAKYLDDFRNRR